MIKFFFLFYWYSKLSYPLYQIIIYLYIYIYIYIQQFVEVHISDIFLYIITILIKTY